MGGISSYVDAVYPKCLVESILRCMSSAFLDLPP